MQPVDPTEIEIAEACRLIRESWSEAEIAKRCCAKAVQWVLPVVEGDVIEAAG